MNTRNRQAKPVPRHAPPLLSPGGPLLIDLAAIDEDPDQPRSGDNPGFSAQSIGELAASYGPHGPKSPISLRDSTTTPGRYIINHGHRRFRAAKVKGLAAIPAFIDNDYNEVDQVIENLQRNELTPREIADWIGRELAKGKRKGEIAKSIGKSAAFVTQHATLLDLPAPIASAFNAARVNDVTVVNELVTAYKRNPDEVTMWLEDSLQEVTRGGVKLLREYLDQKRLEPGEQPDADEASSAATSEEESGTGTEPETPGAGSNERLVKALVLVEHNGRPARLSLKRRPSAVGFAWLKYEDDGQEAECTLAEVKLVALIEGST